VEASHEIASISSKAIQVPGNPHAVFKFSLTACYRIRILVVDDNQDAAKTLSIRLRLIGSEVRTAHDGLEAVATAEVFRPHLMLLDLGMPKLNGYQAAQFIREKPWGQEVMLVALTGWGQDEDRRRTKDSGFDGHLVKPVDLEALTTLLTSMATRATNHQ
jgi:CheY-like chemotaxis protein